MFFQQSPPVFSDICLYVCLFVISASVCVPGCSSEPGTDWKIVDRGKSISQKKLIVYS